MANTWITDLTHLPPPGVDVPKSDRAIANYFFRIADEAMRLGVEELETPTDIQCRRRPGRRPCRGSIHVRVTDDGQLQWHCPECGDNGLLTNWRDLQEEAPFPLYLAEKDVKLLIHYLEETEWEPILRNGERVEGGFKYDLDMEELDDLWIIAGEIMDEVDKSIAKELDIIQMCISCAMDGF